MVNVYIFCVAVTKLNYWYKPGPIVLLIINKNLEVYFYSAILLFILIVNLRVESGKKLLFYVTKLTKQ